MAVCTGSHTRPAAGLRRPTRRLRFVSAAGGADIPCVQADSCKNYAFVQRVADMSVTLAVKRVRDKSSLLRGMADKGEIKQDRRCDARRQDREGDVRRVAHVVATMPKEP